MKRLSWVFLGGLHVNIRILIYEKGKQESQG